MKTLLVLASILISATVTTASADTYRPMVLRASANHYALVGEGTAVTGDCTVTADGNLTAKLDSERGKMFLTFLDRDGEDEGQCEVEYIVRPTPTIVHMTRPVAPKHATRVATR